MQACGSAGKALGKAEADAFIERLAQDAVRRDLNRCALKPKDVRPCDSAMACAQQCRRLQLASQP